MKKPIILIAFLCLSTLLIGQERKDVLCGTPPATEEELSTRKYIGNNDYLLGVLKERGIHLPEDYFQKLDDRGLYKGRKISLAEARGGK